MSTVIKDLVNQTYGFMWCQLKVTLKAGGQVGLKVYKVTKIQVKVKTR